jgi:AraC-like DNA-binding protein
MENMAGSIRKMAVDMQGGQPGQPGEGERGALAAPGLIRLETYPVPTKLRPFVTTLFAFRSDAARISDVLPAAVGYLLVVLEGNCAFGFATGQRIAAHSVTLLTPTSAATGFDVEGPWYMLAVELSTFGWMALTGLHAGQHIDRAYDASAVLGADAAALGDRLHALFGKARGDGAELFAELARFIEPRLQPLNPRHEVLIARVTAWLYASFDPQLADLKLASGYSARQLQRLVERYFGTGPKQLARKYRALRVAGLLLSDECSEAQTADLLNLFYDQSHLIREMRHFVGRTPLKFGKSRSPVLSAVTELRNHRELRPDLVRSAGD